MEQSYHPPLAAAERAALRSARSFARAEGSSGSAGCGAELFLCERREEEEFRSAWSRAAILVPILNSGGRDAHPP